MVDFPTSPHLTFLLTTILTGAVVSIFSVEVNSRRSKVAAAPVPFFSLSLINKPEIISSSLYVLSSRPNLSSCLSASLSLFLTTLSLFSVPASPSESFMVSSSIRHISILASGRQLAKYLFCQTEQTKIQFTSREIECLISGTTIQ